MRRPSELPPELAVGAFDVAAAKALGVGVERLRRRDLRRPFHGVRVAGSTLPAEAEAEAEAAAADKWAERVVATRRLADEYAARMPDDQFFSHVTAAILHELPLPFRLLAPLSLDVATDSRTRRRTGHGVRGHLVSADQVTVVDVGGVPAASVVDTWCQLSTLLSLDELVIIGDWLVRRQRPQATMAQLAAAVDGWAGHPGVHRLRAALDLVRPRTDSPRETTLRLIIVRAGLPEPAVNLRMVNRFGAFMALGDLVYPRYKILIEYDGGVHRENEKQFNRDIDRLDEPMEEGWRVIRVNNSHLGPGQHALIARIRRALLDRGWRPRG